MGMQFLFEKLIVPSLIDQDSVLRTRVTELFYRRVRKRHRMSLPSDLANEVLHASTEAIVIVNNDGLIEFVNQQAELLFGYDADEMIGQKVEMLIPDGMRDGHEKYRSQFVKTPRARPLVSGLSLQGLRKSGETFDAEIALTPIETEQGIVVSSAIRDISEKETSEPFFRNLLESAPDAMIVLDGEGSIALVNAQAQSLFRYSREELLSINLKITDDVSGGIRKYCPDAIILSIANPLDAIVYTLYRNLSPSKGRLMGMAGVLDSARYRYFIAEAALAMGAGLRPWLLGADGAERVNMEDDVSRTRSTAGATSSR